MKAHKVESLMTEKVILLDENGDPMPKRNRKNKTVLFGAVLILVIIFMMSSVWQLGGEKKVEEAYGTNIALEKTLTNVEGVGDVQVYIHQNANEEAKPLSDYFSLTETKGTQKGNDIEGVLVVAEGGGDPSVQNKLTKMLATVLQLSEHRIVVVEMTKGRNRDENK